MTTKYENGGIGVIGMYVANAAARCRSAENGK